MNVISPQESGILWLFQEAMEITCFFKMIIISRLYMGTEFMSIAMLRYIKTSPKGTKMNICYTASLRQSTLSWKIPTFAGCVNQSALTTSTCG